MKQPGVLLLFILLFIQTQAQELRSGVNMRSAQFFLPGEGPYVEMYMVIAGSALHYERNKKHLFEAGVEVQIVILENGTVFAFDKYNLITPGIVDSTSVDFSLMDQKRLFLPDQSATVEVKITDLQDSTNTFEYTEVILPAADNAIAISDIQWVDTIKPAGKSTQFTKNDYDLLPYAADFFPTSRENIRFYGEVYHTDQYTNGEDVLITFSIRSASSDAHNPNFYQYLKSKPLPVISFLRDMDISELPSGNYHLVVEVRNKKNELIAVKKQYFQRAKIGAVTTYDNIAMVNTDHTFVADYTAEQLDYFLEIIKPRGTSGEAKMIESLTSVADMEMKKKFLYNFWLQRNPTDPYGEWKQYLEMVTAVNREFGSPSKPGYRTDRGRVYLQYGPPSDRLLAPNEPNAFPYEIWFYDVLPDKQTKIGFAFYDRTVITNDYRLLHSNARGELHDARWKLVLYENVAAPYILSDFDQTDITDKLERIRPADVYDF